MSKGGPSFDNSNGEGRIFYTRFWGILCPLFVGQTRFLLVLLVSPFYSHCISIIALWDPFNEFYIYILYNYSPCRVFPCFLTFFGHAIWEMWGSHDHASGTPWPSKRVLALTAAIVCWVPMSLVIVGGCPKSGGVNLGMYIHLWVLVSN